MTGQFSFNNLCKLPQEVTFLVNGKEVTRVSRMNMVNNKIYFKYNGDYICYNDLLAEDKVLTVINK